MTGALAYAAVDRTSRVAAASPHGLVMILLGEAADQIDALGAALARGTRGHQAQVKAAAILHALEASLDHKRGGDAAALMARVYREVRRLLGCAIRDNDPQWCKKAREVLEPIIEAWRAIG